MKALRCLFALSLVLLSAICSPATAADQYHPATELAVTTSVIEVASIGSFEVTAVEISDFTVLSCPVTYAGITDLPAETPPDLPDNTMVAGQEESTVINHLREFKPPIRYLCSRYRSGYRY